MVIFQEKYIFRHNENTEYYLLSNDVKISIFEIFKEDNFITKLTISYFFVMFHVKKCQYQIYSVNKDW